MLAIFCSTVLFAVTLTSVSGNYCYTNCTECRTICPRPNAVADLIGYATQCSSLFAILDYGFGCYPLVSLQYDWFVGVRGYLKFYRIYAYFFKIRSKYYYISTVSRGCPALRVLTNSNFTSVPGTFFTEHRATIMLSRFDSAYNGGCHVFVPPAQNDPYRDSSTNGGEDSPLATYLFETPPSASFASPSSTNNANNSYLQEIVRTHGLNLVRTAQGLNPIYPEDFLEFFVSPEQQCGTPGVCKRLNRIKNIESMIKEAGYDISCINPGNSNSGCILSLAIGQGFTLTNIPFMMTSIVIDIIVPPGCNGFTYMRLAGPIYTDSLRPFFTELFQFCH